MKKLLMLIVIVFALGACEDKQKADGDVPQQEAPDQTIETPVEEPADVSEPEADSKESAEEPAAASDAIVAPTDAPKEDAEKQ